MSHDWDPMRSLSLRTRLASRLRPSIAWLLGAIAIAICLGIALTAIGKSDWAVVMLTAILLFVTTLTYWLVTPRPAELLVVRPDELGVADLIFSLRPQDGHGQVPHDVLLQLHVAVINVGGRKALLSTMHLEGLINANGQTRMLPGFPSELAAQLYTQTAKRRSASGMQIEVESETASLPLLIDPEEVVILRFRSRRGIDWSEAWRIAQLREFAEALESPIVSARLRVAYRRGREVVRESIVTSCQVEQQDLYRTRLVELTRNLTRRPSIESMAIAIE